MSVRIGFIGTGGIAGAHLAALATVPDADVVALSDLSQEIVDNTKERVNKRIAESGEGGQPITAAAYDDYGQMLRNERLDGVYLCLPPFAHGEAEDAVIGAGLPLLVEKPVTLELPLAARILAAIRERGLINAVGYQTRYTPYVRRAKELLSDGRTVGMALVTRFGPTPRTSWYHRQDRSGGGVTEMATHQVDLLRHLVGEIETVYCAAATRVNNRNRPDYDIFDVNATTMTFANGAVANFATNFISGLGNPSDGASLQIFCDGMSLSIGRGMQVYTENGTEEVATGGNAMAAEDASFVRAVAEGRQDPIASDYENGVRNLAVTLANDRSARTGQPVNVPALLAAEAPGL